MFDPKEYFASVVRELSRCGEWHEAPGPTLKIEADDHGHWKLITWSLEAILPSDCKLLALEAHKRSRGKHLRKIKYRLMKRSGELIFQFDTHGSSIPFEDACHMHIGPTEEKRVEDSNWSLNGLSLRGFDFLAMLSLIQNYLKDGNVPWR